MRISNLVIILLSLWMAGCQHFVGQENTSSLFVNANYINEFDPRTISKNRNTINFNSGLSADNCASYLKEIKRSSIVEGVNDQIIHGEYLACETYDLIKAKKITKRQFNHNYGGVLSSKLDLTSYPSSLNRRARDQGPTLQDIGEIHLNSDESSVTYETEEWVYRLEVVAITDLNQDGVGDWIVWLLDRSKVGNYHASATLVIHRIADDTLLTATPYSAYVN